MKHLTVLSANLWLLPGPFASDKKLRLQNFKEIVKRSDPDIINLQEVWLSSHVSELRQEFNEYNLVSNASRIFNTSGLVTLTKEKPVSHAFQEFGKSIKMGIVERIINKGFLNIEIEINGKKVQIFNTHLYDSQVPSRQKFKINQSQELLEEAIKEKIAVISGDFNLLKEDFLRVFKEFLHEDTMLPTYIEKNPYTKKLFNQYKAVRYGEDARNTKPDYVAIRSPRARAGMKTEVITDPIVSDHYPILARVRI